MLPTNAAILTSAQKAIDVSVLDFFDQVDGGYLGGTDYSGTLANDGVLLSPYHDYDSQISAELKAEIDALQAALERRQRQGLLVPDRARLLARTRPRTYVALSPPPARTADRGRF